MTMQCGQSPSSTGPARRPFLATQVPPDESRSAPASGVVPQPGAEAPARPAGEAASPLLLDALLLEALVLNLEAALRVHVRSHFFTWTQGLLQSLLPHDVLICALRGAGPSSFRIDSYSTIVADARHFEELLLRDPAVVPDLARAWKERRFLPLEYEAGDAGLLWSGPFGRELARLGVTRALAHGVHDIDGEARSLFVLAARPDTGVPRPRFAEVLVPFLHTAWIRSQILEARAGPAIAAAGAGVLTPREQEILRWIYLGKSNGEVGSILSISPLTVKNHVQKILRKLNVVNRAQAVGKALGARILNP